MMDKIHIEKRAVRRALLTIACLIAVSFVVLLILYRTGVIYFDGGMRFRTELFSDFSSSWYGCILYVVAECFVTVLLCMIPGTSMAFILLGTALFPRSWQAFLLSYTGVMLSSTFMYLLGRIGGRGACGRIMGEKSFQKASDLLRDRGSVYFPLMMLFPLFPDDALVMVAGISKMKMRWFLPSILLGRGVGVATIVFGITLVPFERFETAYDWLVFFTVCAFWVLLSFYGAHRLNLHMQKKRNTGEEQTIDAESREK